MPEQSAVDTVDEFWARVWPAPQDFDAIDELVVEDFVSISGGEQIRSRAAFKQWATSFGAAIADLESEIVESFQHTEGT
jgi:hypothetical protein